MLSSEVSLKRERKEASGGKSNNVDGGGREKKQTWLSTASGKLLAEEKCVRRKAENSKGAS